MVAPIPSHGRSARVRLELHIGSSCHALAQIGDGRLFFDQPVILPGTSGEVRIFIDDHEERHSATWPASATARRVVAASFCQL